MKRAVAIITCLPLLSCATITTGRYEQIKVSTSPSQAHATLVCSGQPAGDGPTPIEFKIRRDAGDCMLNLHKDGFQDQSIAIEQGVNPAYWGNMLLSPVAPAGVFVTVLSDSEDKTVGIGLVGAAVAIFGTDFWTGAVHAHKPATVDVVLKGK